MIETEPTPVAKAPSTRAHFRLGEMIARDLTDIDTVNELPTSVTAADAVSNQLFTDKKTGVYRGDAWMSKLDETIRATSDQGIGHELVVFSVDLDEFKALNDKHGHVAGDQALAVVGKVLQRVFKRSSDVLGYMQETGEEDQREEVGRMGGDEFAGYAVGYGNARRKVSMLTSVIKQLTEAEALLKEEFTGTIFADLSLSVGIALHRDGETAEEVTARADLDMIENKFHDKFEKFAQLPLEEVRRIQDGITSMDKVGARVPTWLRDRVHARLAA